MQLSPYYYGKTNKNAITHIIYVKMARTIAADENNDNCTNTSLHLRTASSKGTVQSHTKTIQV